MNQMNQNQAYQSFDSLFIMTLFCPIDFQPTNRFNFLKYFAEVYKKYQLYVSGLSILFV